jgi:hypothetical protein
MVLFEVEQYSGKAWDREHVLHVLQFLDGEARSWYHRHVVNVNCSQLAWMFEQVIIGLYSQFIHPSTMQDACSTFFIAHYSEDKGIQEFYNILEDHAQNMAVYPDMYQMVETFLKGIPLYIYKQMIKDGLSLETNTINNFIAEVKRHKLAKKTLDYYNKATVARLNPVTRTSQLQTDSTRPKCPVGRMTFACREMTQVKIIRDNQQKLSRPSGDGQKVVSAQQPHQRPPPPPREKHATGQPVGDGKHHYHEHVPGEPMCHNCGHHGHISKDCKAPCKHQVHIRAAHMEVQHDPHDADNELHNEEQRPSPQEYEEDHPDLNENKEYIEVEVNYVRESDTELMSSIFDRAVEPEDMLAIVEANRPEEGWVKIHKAVM